MTLEELINELDALRDEVGGDAQVRLAIQPRWAFAHTIGDVVAVEAKRDEPATVYIGERQQDGYLPARAAVALGWMDARDVDEDDDEDDEPESAARS